MVYTIQYNQHKAHRLLVYWRSAYNADTAVRNGMPRACNSPRLGLELFHDLQLVTGALGALAPLGVLGPLGGSPNLLVDA